MTDNQRTRYREVNDDLAKILIESIKMTSFTQDYEATDEEAVGLIISHHFEWDGVKILEACARALEDANFHAESAIIDAMKEKL